MGKCLLIIVCWIAVLATGAHLRLDRLDDRPVHCDEATGARLTAKRMESGRSQFDPTHFHGPILSSAAIPICKARGETTWQTLSAKTLRLGPAAAGILTILVPLAWCRRFGHAPTLLAAALIATSPLLVYYSRMFIHETYLGLFGLLALTTLTAFPRWGIPGLCIGLMYAAKESVIISLIAWSCAAIALAILHWRKIPTIDWTRTLHTWRLPLLASTAAALATATWFYSDGLRHPLGLLDAVRTFFIYQTGDGHDKPFFYYLHLLLYPFKSGGVWWFGTLTGLLAVIAVIRSLRGHLPFRQAITIQFLALSAAAHFTGYGLIAYKTPWLMVLPWAHVCLLAGLAVTRWRSLPIPTLAATTALATAALATQVRQSNHANGRLATDERNPLAYVPTRRNVVSIEPWLTQIAKTAPSGTIEPIAVIGSGYWPLPWYLRQFHTIGYWPSPPPGLTDMPVVFAVPETDTEVSQLLASTHTPLPRGLRPNVSLTLHLRNDLWNAWQTSGR